MDFKQCIIEEGKKNVYYKKIKSNYPVKKSKFTTNKKFCDYNFKK